MSDLLHSLIVALWDRDKVVKASWDNVDDKIPKLLQLPGYLQIVFELRVCHLINLNGRTSSGIHNDYLDAKTSIAHSASK